MTFRQPMDVNSREAGTLLTAAAFYEKVRDYTTACQPAYFPCGSSSLDAASALRLSVMCCCSVRISGKLKLH